MKQKVKINISDTLFNRYAKICNGFKLDPYKELETMMSEYIASSLEFKEDICYQLKTDVESDAITITKRENNFLTLSNGNRIHVLDFEKLYEGLDPMVRRVLEQLDFAPPLKVDFVEGIDVETFMNGTKTIIENITNEIKNIDDNNIKEETKNYFDPIEKYSRSYPGYKEYKEGTSFVHPKVKEFQNLVKPYSEEIKRYKNNTTIDENN